MNLAVAATVFAVVFSAELPDKTALASLVLATRYRACWVFAGVAAAFTLHVAVAVTTGRLLALLPHQVVQGLTAALFTLGAVLLVVGRHGKPDQAPTAGREQTGFLRVAGMAFAAVLVAEFGDLTQLVTANLTAKYDDSLAVGLGVLTGAGHGVLIQATTAEGGRCCRAPPCLPPASVRR